MIKTTITVRKTYSNPFDDMASKAASVLIPMKLGSTQDCQKDDITRERIRIALQKAFAEIEEQIRFKREEP